MLKAARLEACSLCQLSCPGCIQHHSSMKHLLDVRSGYLSLNNFKKFIKLNPEIRKIELSNSGEIFLNPELLEILRHAFKSNVRLSAHNGVNLNAVSDKVLETIVTTNFGTLAVSIDAASEKTYQCYRQGGNFNQVIKNIEKINFYKKKHQSLHPPLLYRYIIFPSNDIREEIVKAKKLAKTLNMKMLFQKDYHGYTPKDVVMIKTETGLIYNTSENVGTLVNYHRDDYFPCFSLWHEPQINWDGRFFGCCANFWRNFTGGNLFEMSLDDFMKTPLIHNSKAMLQGGKPAMLSSKLSPCYMCKIYKHMVEHQDFIRDEEIAKFASSFG